MTGRETTKTLFVHIGLHKTGTTSIQQCLSHGSYHLHKAGYLYPSVGRHPLANTQHALLPKVFDPSHPHGGAFALTGPIDGDLLIRALRHEIDLSGLNRVIISSEEFSRLGRDQILAVGRAFHGFDVRPIAFVRNFPALFEGLYGTLIQYSTGTLLPSDDLMDTNIAPRFEAWAAIAGNGKLHCVDYDASPSGNAIEDFLLAIGLDANAIPEHLRQWRLNKSPPAADIARMRAARLAEPEPDANPAPQSNLSPELNSTLAERYAEQMRILRGAPFVTGLDRVSIPNAKAPEPTTTVAALSETERENCTVDRARVQWDKRGIRRMNRRLRGLDALRGIAAVSAMLAHIVLVNKPPSTPAMVTVASYLTLAVPLFFALSAFSLAYGYHKRLSTWGEVREYALRRFLRIAPLFYVMAIAWMLFRGDLPSAKKLILNVTFLFGFSKGHFSSLVPAGWSIGVEMIFYALLPALLLWIRDQKTAIIGIIVSLIAGYAFNEMLPASTKQMDIWFARMNFVTNAANFMGGLWAYFFYRSVAASDPLHRRRLSLMLLSTAVMLWFLTYCLSRWFGSLDHSFVHRYIVSAAFPIIIVALALVPWRLLVNRMTTWVGKVSYSIYLTHVLVIMSIEPIRQHLYVWWPEAIYVPMGVSIVAIGISTLLVSSVAYTLIERPSMKLGERVKLRTDRALPDMAPASRLH